MTDHIEAFTPTGLRLCSGVTLDADVIVTATGLNLLPLGGVANLAFALGYTNASWTLKVDLVSSYVARLLAAMRRKGYGSVTPRLPSEPMRTTPFIEMTSGYFERSRATLPLQGDSAPWRLRQLYTKDAALFDEPMDDRELEFIRGPDALLASPPVGEASTPAPER